MENFGFEKLEPRDLNDDSLLMDNMQGIDTDSHTYDSNLNDVDMIIPDADDDNAVEKLDEQDVYDDSLLVDNMQGTCRDSHTYGSNLSDVDLIIPDTDDDNAAASSVRRHHLSTAQTGICLTHL